MRFYAETTQAVIIDLQEKLLPAMYNEEKCIEKSVMLIKGLRILDIPFLFTQQYTKGLGMTVDPVLKAAKTEEYFEKRSFSAYQDEKTRDKIHSVGRKNILIFGTEAHVCVLQTCLDLKEAGFRPILVVDAIASRRSSDKKIAIKRAMQEGIILTTSESILFELLEDSRSPKFREISALVK